MNYQNREFVEKNKFKFSHHETSLNYDMYSKGKEWRLIIFYGEETDHFYEVPRYWFVKNNLSKFEGDIHNEEEFKLICSLIHV